MESGETRLLAKYSNHTVIRAEDPAMFWIAIVTISGFGIICAALGTWLTWAALRRR